MMTPAIRVQAVQPFADNQNSADRAARVDQFNEGIVSTINAGLTIDQLTQGFIHVAPFDDTFYRGIDRDILIGAEIGNPKYYHNDLLAKAQAIGTVEELSGGYIGGRHWSEFVESMFGLLDTYLGLGTETYECTTVGMTKAWNAKENQLCEGAGECLDLNGDGYIGNAPTGDNCD